MRRTFASGLIVAVALLLSAISVWAVRSTARERTSLRFENAVQGAEDRVSARLETYVAALRGATAFFAASDSVSRDEFHAYVERLQLQRRFPGIQGLGYTVPLTSADERRFVAEQRALGRPGYTLWPDSAGVERHAIVYLEPEDARNLLALGYNMFSEPTRRAAMDQARRSGQATMSGRVELVQERGETYRQAGFLIYMPVYVGATLPATPAQRVRQFRGFVYAPFRADDLLKGVFGAREQSRVAFRIYDGTEVNSSSLLHDSRRAGVAPVARPAHHTRRQISIAGRTWTIVFNETPYFDRGTLPYMEWYVALLCLGLTILLYGFIHAQQRTAEDAQEAEQRLAALLEGMPVGVLVADADNRFIFANTTARRLWGVDEADSVESLATWSRRLHQPSPDPFGVQRALSGQPTGNLLLQLNTPESLRTVLCVAFPLRDARSGALQAVVTAVDLTDRVRAEEALREREREFAMMANSIPQMAWMTDETGFTFWYNDRWYAYTGTTLEEMKGWGWKALHHPDHLDGVVERFSRALTAGEPWEDTFPLRGADGTYRWFLSRALPIRDEDGHIVRWFGTNTDITNQRDAQEAEARAIREQAAREAAEAREGELRRVAAELARSNRELQDFAYIASHDLQEPLRRISAFADLVRLDYAPQLDEQGRFYLDRIQHGALRLSRLIRDLLTFSRVTTRRQVFERVDLQILVEDVRTDLGVRLQETDGCVIFRDLPTIEADPTQMRQLFQNLIANAIKFHREGVPPRVEVGVSRQPNPAGVPGWRIEVRDNGIGFETQYAERIFTPFQRLHAQGVYEGTGIGLAICRRIAEHHQGTIEASSVPGEGTTFHVWLPERPVAASEPNTPAALLAS